MKKNIATVLFKYINKNHNNEELLKDLNELQELYPNDKKEINKMIEKINDIISSTLLEIERDSKIEKLLFEWDYYIKVATSMTPFEVATMIGDLFYLQYKPHIDQEYFDDMVAALKEKDEREYLWRLGLNYNRMFDMDKIETYFIDKKDSYYLTELISVLDEPNYYRIACKLINKKDKELIKEVIRTSYIEFPEYLHTKLEKFIKD